jgi:beta-phosphoglucomutase family hydrolase
MTRVPIFAAKLVKMEIEAVIFDLDGTLVDNNPYHLEAWKRYLKKIGRELSEEEYNTSFNGRTNKDVVEYIHKRQMTNEEAAPYYLEKEALYRELYQPFIAPVPGLLDFLQEIDNAGIPMAIATSGITVNIDFMFEHIPVKHFFKAVINSTHIRKGKPDPEIYLKAAEALDAHPDKCVVFEDAIVGIEAAKAAGMKVVALTTTHSADELHKADRIIHDYTEINLSTLRSFSQDMQA